MKRLAVVAAVFAALLVPATPTHASPAVAIQLSLTMSLPSFPCASPCTGTVTGTYRGYDETGLTLGSPWSGSVLDTGTCVSGTGSIGPLTYTRFGPAMVVVGTWGPHPVAGAGTFVLTSPLLGVPPGCLPGGTPGPVTLMIQAALAGV